ncbi:ferric-rhodotorulic acid/ferric-coprogen receptor FhuE [Rouxiella sp. T17]|uniref:ferric-rhodotorulic acid/ferric-coprogen receptor FhuE n=1 Tax=Rouxiella sp. T17 TaxID=3085684 RepID=UPI002FC5B4B4
MSVRASKNSGHHVNKIAVNQPEWKATLSVLTVLIGSALYTHNTFAAEQTAAKSDTIVVSANSDDPNTTTPENSGAAYQVQTTTAGTGLTLAPRDVPQSVSVITKQRIQDQDLQSVGEVLDQTVGVTSQSSDSERQQFYSRGFEINNYTFDGVPTNVTGAWNFGDSTEDTAIYDRIEVVRGATGLMSGAGNPSASVNMVRKHADSKEWTGNVTGTYGSWNKRRSVVDVQGPLNDSGTVRARVVAGYQDKDSYLDNYKSIKRFVYGVVDADITDNTKLSVGYDYQESRVRGSTWGGIPTWYTDGSKTNFSRSFNPAPDWAHYNIDSKKVFADLTHQFDNGWNLRVNGTHAETNFDSKLMYIDGFPNKTTGIGATGYGGWYLGKRKLDSVDAMASGPFQLFGRQHELIAGVTYSRQNNSYMATTTAFDEDQIGNLNDWDGSMADPQWADMTPYSGEVIRQKSAYSAARFSLADPLNLIVGARYTKWSAEESGAFKGSASYEKNNIAPYAGLVYDINDTWSAYASYTSIFQPQDYQSTSGKLLDPITGKAYEAGVKSDWYNGSLTASAAVFRIEQDNLAQTIDGQFVAGTGDQAYYAAQGTVSKGVEFEVNGAVTDNLKMTFGGTTYSIKDGDNNGVSTNLPRTSFKLFTRYKLPIPQDIAVGGGATWQNRTYQDTTGVSGESVRIYQGSYALFSLFTRYQITPELSAQVNINNLFDKTYYTNLSNYIVYGEPRNASISLSYKF